MLGFTNKQTLPFNELLALSVMGAEASPALPEIMEALRKPETKGNALTALRSIRAAAVPAMPELIALLQDPNWWARIGAEEALMNIGPAAREALPAVDDLAHGA